MAINEMDARLISQGTQVESVGAEALIPVATAEGQPQSNITLANLAGSMGEQASDVADIKTIWGQTADGKMVQINKASIASVLGNLLYGADTKEELASVVAGQMTTSRLWNMNTYNGGDADLNNLAGYGFSYVSNGLNFPTGETVGGCLYFSYCSAYKVQFFTNYSKLYSRVYTGVWSAWAKIV